MKDEGTGVIYCGRTIKGPRVGRRVVLWIKNCRHRVKKQGDYCWQHGGPK